MDRPANLRHAGLMTTITVLAATGKTGKRVAAHLEAAGVTVRRAARRSAARFDWDDDTTWEPAIAGVDGVYLVPPESSVEPFERFVALLERVGAPRVTLLSARHPDQSGDDQLLRAEAAVTTSALAWSVLRPSWFDQNFDEGMFADELASGTLRLPTGDGREPFIDAEDIAAVAARTLLDDGHSGSLYELSGPEALTFAEATTILAAATGRELRFEAVDPADYADGLRSGGLPEPVVALYGSLLAAIRTGANDHLSDGVATVLGRAPTSFAEFARRSALAGR